jgi:hypothetical protein
MCWLGLLAFAAAPAVAETTAEAGGAQVQTGASLVVDRIVFEGDHDVREELLTSALDVPVGTPLPRMDLDQRLERGRARLEALAYFKSVDLSLAKGDKRGHVTLTVRLVARSSAYAGATILRNRDVEHEANGDFKNDSLKTRLFVGTRNLGGTGLRGEVSIWQNTNEASFGGGNDNTYETRDRVLQLSLYEPSIADSPWFGGMSLGYIDQKARSDFTGTETSSGSTSEGYYRLGLVSAGRRFGLFSASALMVRMQDVYHTRSDSYRDHYEYFYSAAQLKLRYSDKSGLVTVEPGTIVSLAGSRPVAPAWDRPNYEGRFEHTFLMKGVHALTPAVRATLGWIESSSFDSSGGVTSQSVSVDRNLDTALTYQYVLAERYVLGIGYGASMAIDQDRSFGEDRVRRRTSATATYQGEGLIFELAFVYGNPGIDSDEESFMPNHDRLAE